MRKQERRNEMLYVCSTRERAKAEESANVKSARVSNEKQTSRGITHASQGYYSNFTM